MSAASGKMLKSDDSVFDVTALLDSINTALAGTGIKVSGGGSAGSASSGDSTHMSPEDFTAVYASATTLTLTGFDGFTPTAAQFVSVKRQDTTGVSVTYTPDANAFSFNPTTGVLTVTGAAFTATDVFVVTVLGREKRSDKTADAKKVASVIPLENRQTSLLSYSVSNISTVATHYIDVSSYDRVMVQFDKTGGVDTLTYTISATAQDDGTADSSCKYDDITQYGTVCLTAGAAASFTADCAHQIITKGMKYLKLTITPSGGANDGDYAVYVSGCN